MSFIKNRTCSVCGREFVWVIDRPGDGYWDRFRNDTGDTVASWFTANTKCYDHALADLPDQFSHLIRTQHYEESDPAAA